MRALPYTHQTLRRSRGPMIPLIIACVGLYFAFYLVFGPRGLFNLNRLQHVYEEKNQNYEELAAKREKLESSVKLMRPKSLDPDMAEEQARKTLGYAKTDDVVIDLP